MASSTKQQDSPKKKGQRLFLRAQLMTALQRIAMDSLQHGNFLSRIEVLVSGNFIIFGLTKVTVCLYVGCRGLARVFGAEKYRAFAAAAIVGMIVASQFIYQSTMQMFAFLDVYKRYAPAFEIGIPLALLIGLSRKQTTVPVSADGSANNGPVSL